MCGEIMQVWQHQCGDHHALLCKQVCNAFDVSQTTDANMGVTQRHFTYHYIHGCDSQADYMNCVYLLSGCLDTIAITISTADQIDLLC